MKEKILTFLMLAAANLAAPAQTNSLQLPVARGPFVGTMDSLTNYSYPKWFRDAKFGIWAHWGPQSVPMEGDWYARKMYQQNQPDYTNHLERWAIHPPTAGKTSSRFGKPRIGTPYCPKTRTSLKVLEFRWVTSQGYSKDAMITKLSWHIDIQWVTSVSIFHT